MGPGTSPEPSRPALFLDRDGVLNEEVGHLHDPRELVMIPRVGLVLADCNRRGVLVLVVTNQAGIERGRWGVDDYKGINRAMSEALARDGARVDAWYFCPHAPESACACRKPRPGMLLAAASELGLDLRRSVLVGDQASDLEAARAAGARAVLVRTGLGRRAEAALAAGGRGDLFDACHDSLEHAHGTVLALLGLGLGIGLGRSG